MTPWRFHARRPSKLQGVRKDSEMHGYPKETQEKLCAHRSADLPHASSEAHFARQFVRDFPENLQVKKKKLSYETPLKITSCKMLQVARKADKQSAPIPKGNARRFLRPSFGKPSPCIHHVLCCTTGTSGVRYLSKLISCSAFFKKWKLWNRSFRASRPSKTESWSCENEAFMRGVLQKLHVEVVKTKL